MRRFRILAPMLATLVAASSWGLSAADATHLLERTGFGIPAALTAHLSKMTRAQAVDWLLAQAKPRVTAPPPSWANAPIPRPPAKTSGEDPKTALAARAAFQAKERERGRELQAWWIHQMIVTSSPLEERMVLFWHNHFTSSLQKVRSPELMLRQDLLIRKFALGNYATFVHAISKDPAMIIYLDNETNRKGRANENYAREVMELFTLGEGHYTEADVKAAARAFTGWRVNPRTGEFVLDPRQHDNSRKKFLGKSGNWNGDDILDIILKQKQASLFIAGELWKEFISPKPDKATVAKFAGDFRAHHYDIKVLVRDILLSRAFWEPANRNSLVKSPVELMVGMVRTLGMDRQVDAKEQAHIAAMSRALGQDLFNPLSVKGWPYGSNWIHSDTLLGRERAISYILRLYGQDRKVALRSEQMKHLRGEYQALAYELD